MTTVKHIPSNKQFIMKIGEHTAFVNYTMRNGKMHLVYAQVPYELRGQGHGKPLIEGTFELLTQEGHKAVAICSYVKLIAMRSEKWRDIIQH